MGGWWSIDDDVDAAHASSGDEDWPTSARGNTNNCLFLSRISSTGTISHFYIIEIQNTVLQSCFRGPLPSGGLRVHAWRGFLWAGKGGLVTRREESIRGILFHRTSNHVDHEYLRCSFQARFCSSGIGARDARGIFFEIV